MADNIKSKMGFYRCGNGGKWQTLKVSEFAYVIGGGTPATKIEQYWNGSIPWLTPKDLSNHEGRYISKGERYISKKGLKNSSARILPAKTVLLTSRAPVGYVAIAENEICTNQGFRNLVVKDGFDSEFVYYLLLHNTEYLKQHASGSTFQELSGSTLKELKFRIPPFSEQRAIACILGSLDDKIELNRKTNETLEAMAHAIFKSWFVDFDPVIDNALRAGNPIPEYMRERAEIREIALPAPQSEAARQAGDLFPDSFQDSELGQIPKGWEVIPFGALLEKTIGGDWGKEYRDNNHTRECVIIRGTDIPDLISGSQGKAPTRWVEEKKLKTRQLMDGDIVIEISGGSPKQPTGRSIYISDRILSRLGDTAEPASFCRLFRAKTKYIGLFCAQHLSYIYGRGKMWEYQNQSTGISNFQTNTFLEKELLPMPKNNQVLEAFYAQGRPLIDASHSNESWFLAKLRDTLLPKLISGELRVLDAEKFIEGIG